MCNCINGALIMFQLGYHFWINNSLSRKKYHKHFLFETLYSCMGYLGDVWSLGCTVYVLTGKSLRWLFIWLLRTSWLRYSTLSLWCRCGVCTLAEWAIRGGQVVLDPPVLDTSLIDPCHLRVSLDDPELALDSCPSSLVASLSLRSL